MDLQSFYPYQLAVLAEAVSQAMAQVYAARFDLTRDEWRLIAGLAELGPTKTTELMSYSTLQKMPASRAAARLEERGLIERSTDAGDRRNHVLRLTPAGAALVRKIEPMVQAREQFLLDALDKKEQALLAAAHDKLLARARQMLSQG
jgi:DNA-binding MarR family transcriptional regulator